MYTFETSNALQVSKLTGVVRVGGDKDVNQCQVADTCSLWIVWKVQNEITIVNEVELPQMFKPIMLCQEAKGVEILGQARHPSGKSHKVGANDLLWVSAGASDCGGDATSHQDM